MKQKANMYLVYINVELEKNEMEKETRTRNPLQWMMM